jgi:hypothetical protein
MISEFDRLKSEELQLHSQEWNLQRTISKINYRIHTDAIKEHIIPPVVTKDYIRPGLIISYNLISCHSELVSESNDVYWLDPGTCPE